MSVQWRILCSKIKFPLSWVCWVIPTEDPSPRLKTANYNLYALHTRMCMATVISTKKWKEYSIVQVDRISIQQAEYFII